MGQVRGYRGSNSQAAAPLGAGVASRTGERGGPSEPLLHKSSAKGSKGDTPTGREDTGTSQWDDQASSMRHDGHEDPRRCPGHPPPQSPHLPVAMLGTSTAVGVPGVDRSPDTTVGSVVICNMQGVQPRQTSENYVPKLHRLLLQTSKKACGTWGA